MTLLLRARAVSDGLNQIVIVACIGFLLVMLAISFVGCFYMIGTGAALSWTYSLARLFIPWIAMLSITIAFKSGEHIAMAMLLERFPAPAATALRCFNLALIGLSGLLLVWYGWEFFVNSTQYFMVSDQIQVHHRWVAACMPVTGLVLLVHLVCGFALLEPSQEVLDEMFGGSPEAIRDDA